MEITIKTPEEIEKLKIGGHILADTLRELEKYCKEHYKENIRTADIDKMCGEILEKNGVKPSFLGYSSGEDSNGFPANLCVSINDEVVHGLPSDRILKEGDLVSLDLGVIYEGLYTDAAISFVVGEGAKVDELLVNAAKSSLYAGIEQIKPGNTIGDIGLAIGKSILNHGFGIVRNYCGHGVGYAVHEAPSVPNYGKRGVGEVLEEGMVLAIEPMLVMGEEKVFVDGSGWTVKTSDGKKASHWEHTVAVTKNGAIVLTQ